MEYTHVCEVCGEEHTNPIKLDCTLCRGLLLEQISIELDVNPAERGM